MQVARRAQTNAGAESAIKQQGAPYLPQQPRGPMIVRTAQLTLVTKEFDDARAALDRILRQRTGRVADILAVEREIARVRGETERLEAQLKNLENQAHYATVQLRVAEEYKAQLDVPPTSTTTRLRNAFVDGYPSLVESAAGLALFLLSYGPVLIFWGLILFWPARFMWRRLPTQAGVGSGE